MTIYDKHLFRWLRCSARIVLDGLKSRVDRLGSLALNILSAFVEDIDNLTRTRLQFRSAVIRKSLLLNHVESTVLQCLLR
jgi:hypothetical protein